MSWIVRNIHRLMAARQCRLEREAHTLVRQFAQALQHHLSGCDRHAIGVVTREVPRDHVGVDEFIDLESALQ